MMTKMTLMMTTRIVVALVNTMTIEISPIIILETKTGSRRD